MNSSISISTKLSNDPLIQQLEKKSSKVRSATLFDIQRSEPRVRLATTLYLRRPINSESYRHKVISYDLSRHGASIISDTPLEIGAQIEVYGFNDRFTAAAIVRHREFRTDGQWSIGLEFINSSGSWLIQ